MALTNRIKQVLMMGLVFGFIFPEALAVVRPKKDRSESLKSYLTLKINPEEGLRDGNSETRSIRRALQTIYKKKVNIEIGKRIFFRAKEGYSVSVLANFDKKKPTRYLKIKVIVARKDGSIEEMLMQTSNRVPYKMYSKNGKRYYRVTKSLKRTKRDKFGEVRCEFKLASSRGKKKKVAKRYKLR